MVELQVGFVGLQLYREKQLYSRCCYISCTMKHCVYLIIMLKHMLLFHVESESEPILVEQVVEESPVVSGFDNCGTDPEPEIINEGRPRFMH